jgi:hypothetical protein
MRFQRVLRRAAIRGRISGALDRQGFRSMFRATFNADAMEAAMAEVASSAVTAGLIQPCAAGQDPANWFENIDWEALFAFIMELLPVIMQIIIMFI